MPWSEYRRQTQARIKAGEGFIYAAHIKASHISGEYIKVGFSLTPLRRVYRDLGQNRRDGRVRLLGYIPGSIVAERALHDRLYGRRRSMRHGDGEQYDVSILKHPQFPAGLLFPATPARPRRRPDVEAA